MTARFEVAGRSVGVNLEPSEFAVLERIPSLVGSVGAPPSDPAAARLDPPVHPDEPAASAEFVRLVGSDVTNSRVADASQFSHSLALARDGDRIGLDDLGAWARAISTARIVLASRNGTINDDEAFASASRADPDLLLIDYLGVLEEELLVVLLGTLPESDADPYG